MTRMSDEAGDDPGTKLARLYDRLGPSLFRYAVMILADPAEAEDVIQRVFLALVGRSGEAIGELDHYVRRAVRNEAFSSLRRLRPGEVGDAALLENVAVHDEAVTERLMLEQALRALPADQREVVHLHVYEGMTFAEIGVVSDAPPNTVASRYRYAIEKLKQSLANGTDDDR
jgi:RNA polymerase sigma-70 factor (ECF subfamily)